jgi:hypothetical protein
MGRFGKKDPKLGEVKAVLQRLQGFPHEPDATAAPSRPDTRQGRRAALVTAAIVLASIASAAGIFGAVFLIGSTGRMDLPPIVQTPGTAQKLPEPAVKAAMDSARGLMAKGKVRAAREQLAGLAARGSSDAAWGLARSYDPNVLAELPTPDATPDVKEATRWYRAWYAGAVKEGLVADSVSLERIIGSMRQ